MNAFCAFCRSPRRLYRKKRVGLFEITASMLGAAALTGLIFQEVDARGFLFFVFFLAVAETFIQLRWRMTVVCPHCGFDPLLYLRKPEAAAEKVKAHLERRREDPASLLSAPLQLPKRRPAKKEEMKPAPEKSSRGSRLSKHV